MHNRLNFLIFACILVVVTLGSIQYYLVGNTYRLTREQYRLEVRSALDAARQTVTGRMFEQAAADSLQKLARRYTSGQISRKGFPVEANRRLAALRTAAGSWYQHIIRDSLHLDGAVYQASFREIIIESNGRLDTVLDKMQPPLIFGGAARGQGEAVLVHREESRRGEFEQRRVRGVRMKSSSLFVRALATQTVYLGQEQPAVFLRMAGILLLALLLLSAVVILFYLVFRALFRQKRLTEIRSDFANNVTHELKTPLSSTAVILQSLQTPEAGRSEVFRNSLLEAMQLQQDKLQRIVDSVLDNALAEVTTPERSPILISRFLRDYAASYPVNGHRLTVDVPEAEEPVCTNLPALEKVLNNLVDNAIKYTPADTLIRLLAYRKADAYLIEVQDEGPGIPAQYRKQVFEKFFRIPEQNRHNVKGLGLGLAISLQTMRSLGGKLDLTIPAGKGCIFTIHLPLTC